MGLSIEKNIVKKIIGLIPFFLIITGILVIGIVLSEKKHTNNSYESVSAGPNQFKNNNDYDFWNDHVYWIGSVTCDHCHKMRPLNKD